MPHQYACPSTIYGDRHESVSIPSGLGTSVHLEQAVIVGKASLRNSSGGRLGEYWTGVAESGIDASSILSGSRQICF